MKLIDDQTRFVAQALVRPIDVGFFFLLIMGGVTTFYWWIFGHPTAESLIAALLGASFFTLLWLVTLAFRLGHLVLQTRADINLLPEVAARIAVEHLSGVTATRAAQPTAAGAPGRPAKTGA